ncbi:hypothetical protein F5I97DRAFT_1804916 [Phlebopus sp. FC_14]|nr:hypothetical protein F5I97DRAFT_1804916 [Phlebopus sp. FC_14]
MTLTRSQFDQACKEFIRRDRNTGWSWKEHSHLPGFGYMERATLLSRPLARDTCIDCGMALDPPDATSALPCSVDPLTCQQYVVLSATFRVPTFYFAVYDSSGGPPVLSHIMQTSLFRRDACEGAEATTYSLGHLGSPFPLLSFGDHPTLNTPCWYLHPCQTGPAVDEILAAGGYTSADGVRWLEAWFMVLGSVIDLGS